MYVTREEVKVYHPEEGKAIKLIKKALFLNLAFQLIFILISTLYLSLSKLLIL